ncbi:glycosyltransferase BC10-like [Dioscorea cayenensis subsp. rotundata]|uniref:Glycosyltransferase BC10-like n=1 Tax=Dioscorea cayennensis subsp. rotundata TaxID=55577 RepID=A0AB40BVF3_DIOCR|nr:glycosyltransferase BC10-like [Dioscorea cayenensis subsp. rotundata]
MATSSPLFFSFSLLLSLPLVLLLAPRLLSPKTLPPIPAANELQDLALFRRATLSSSNLSSSDLHSTRPKIAFLFLTNSDLSFSPLWELFFSSHSSLFNVYVHADPSTHLLLPQTPSFRHRFIPSQPTSRSSPTLISAARRLLAAALLDDPLNSFFALLSQHCIPLNPFPSLYHSLLSQRPLKSFIEILADEPSLHARYVARGDLTMLPEVPFPQFRVGSQFFVLTRRHALLVVRDRRLWKKFRLPCLKSRESSCYPEEHYFPTLLSMRDPAGCSGYTLTRVNWTESVDGHPHLYGPGEVSADLIRTLRKSNSSYEYMFARKFSPSCLEPLMELANTVILKD